MKRILLKIRFLYLGIKNINKLNIGDIVVYNNEKYWLSSYKSTYGDGSHNWSMINLKNGKYEIHNEKDFKKVHSLKNIKNAINGTYQFYMTNWYGIMIRDNISYKNIFKVTYGNYFNLVNSGGNNES